MNCLRDSLAIPEAYAMKLPRVHSISVSEIITSFFVVASIAAAVSPASGQVRTKKPDRGVYRPPTLLSPADASADLLVEVPLEDASKFFATEEEMATRGSDQTVLRAQPRLKQVAHSDVILMSPQSTEVLSSPTIVDSGTWPTPMAESASGGGIIYEDAYAGNGEIYYDDSSMGCGGCGSQACDGFGCDSYGCDGYGQCGTLCWPWANSNIAFTPDRWFGSIELLLMFRSGDYLPPLLTTGPATANNPGQIGSPGTQILVGNAEYLADMTAGGRLTVGTWLDDCRSRSLVFRGWFAGDETFDFSADQNTLPVITRPFLNVTTGQAAAQDTQVIATPGLTTLGVANVNLSSEVAGADISVRQHAYSRFGGTVDVLYGYQYMRMAENLTTFSTSTADADNAAPLGSIISITDSFEAENEFHGGQLGMATRYREGCWSFHSLLKFAFGQLTRRSTLAGSTATSNGPTVVDPNGLLVRSTNDGTVTDHTFGWVPELDLSLGWHQFPRFDVTVGYHIVAMTDAIQTSGLIDPQLASNLAEPIADPLRPSPRMNDKTFYVHGIHFGLQYVY
ncbi:BBP7 family outer membrane beta-barrel protein [Novipirellula artificiosorum]|nr:BBP7 family outer membrane beta-barrel protein [Novipirellula artificiosorum]